MESVFGPTSFSAEEKMGRRRLLPLVLVLTVWSSQCSGQVPASIASTNATLTLQQSTQAQHYYSSSSTTPKSSSSPADVFHPNQKNNQKEKAEPLPTPQPQSQTRPPNFPSFINTIDSANGDRDRDRDRQSQSPSSFPFDRERVRDRDRDRDRDRSRERDRDRSGSPIFGQDNNNNNRFNFGGQGQGQGQGIPDFPGGTRTRTQDGFPSFTSSTTGRSSFNNFNTDLNNNVDFNPRQPNPPQQQPQDPFGGSFNNNQRQPSSPATNFGLFGPAVTPRTSASLKEP